MEQFGKRLRLRGQQLGLSDAEVARRAGLSERRYGNYIVGRREPDFATLGRIAVVLGLTPNDLLGTAELPSVDGERTALLERLRATAACLCDDDLRIIVAEADAISQLRNPVRST